MDFENFKTKREALEFAFRLKRNGYQVRVEPTYQGNMVFWQVAFGR
jgi:hypothetical protein